MPIKHSARVAGVNDSDDAATVPVKRHKQGVMSHTLCYQLFLLCFFSAVTTERNTTRLKRFITKYKPDTNSAKVTCGMCDLLPCIHLD